MSAAFLHPDQSTTHPMASLKVSHALGWNLADWSDFEITFRISGRIIVKKNNLAIITLGKGPFAPRRIAPNNDYKKWEERAAAELAEQWASIFPFATPYPIQDQTRFNLRVVTYFEDKRGIPDLCATYEGPQDVLEDHKPTCDRDKCAKHGGVIANDKFVCGHVGSDRLLDPDDPRVELTLTPHRPTPNP